MPDALRSGSRAASRRCAARAAVCSIAHPSPCCSTYRQYVTCPEYAQGRYPAGPPRKGVFMPVARLMIFPLATAAIAGCGDNGNRNFATTSCAQVTTGQCLEIEGGDAEALQTAANSTDVATTIVLGTGTFKMANQLTIRGNGVHLIGQGLEATTLDFGSTTVQGNGVDVMGNDFLVQDLTVLDVSKDGIRVEASDGVVFRRIRATWTTPG